MFTIVCDKQYHVMHVVSPSSPPLPSLCMCAAAAAAAAAADDDDRNLGSRVC